MVFLDTCWLPTSAFPEYAAEAMRLMGSTVVGMHGACLNALCMECSFIHNLHV